MREEEEEEEEEEEGRSTEGWRAKPHVGGENDRERRWKETRTERERERRVKEGQMKMDR